jgi:hypothetical protein
MKLGVRRRSCYIFLRKDFTFRLIWIDVHFIRILCWRRNLGIFFVLKLISPDNYAAAVHKVLRKQVRSLFRKPGLCCCDRGLVGRVLLQEKV